MNTMMMLGQLLGGATRVWLEFAFVVSIFTILAFRPERIRSVSLLQAACGLLALSMILPSLLIFVIDESAGSTAFGGSRTGQAKDIGMIVKLITASGPILFALAFLCAAFSVMPAPNTNSRPVSDEEPTA
ncbi:MAG: hypothetical protein HQ518_19945 [Rhodopirellula sp.]|nr:hypothetical protein [Rhodopirellula sp.]